MFLVFGLGNPGRKYVRTRHNAGFLVADRLAERWHVAFDVKQFNAEVSKARLRDTPVILAKPQTFMNLSGHAVSSLRRYYKVPDDHIVVVHDESDIPFGQVRVKRGGGHGGHNGVRDVKQQLGSGDFVRVRFGVSRPPPQWETADHVLASWSPEEAERLAGLVDRAADAVESVLLDGVQAAMNTFNERSRSKREPEAGDPPAGGPTEPGSA